MNLPSAPNPATLPTPPAAAQRRSQHELWRHLWHWTLGALLVVWLSLVAVAWYVGHHEAEEITDGQLVAVSRLWLAASPGALTATPQPHDRRDVDSYVQDVAVLEWVDDRLVADTHGLVAGLGLSRPPPLGLSELNHTGTAGSSHWRMYVGEQVGAGSVRRVAVLMDMAQRYDLGLDVAGNVARPTLLVLPLVALVLWWTIRRGLQPLENLSREVAALDTARGQRLDDQQRYREFSSTVTAINTLVETLQTRALREREFASDVAHELRTPLSVIALQARAAQAEPTPEHLQRLEQQALRAGSILTQLLDLARAQRTGSDSEPVDTALGAVAASLVAAHAQQAYDSGHELSLLQPDLPVSVRVPPMLLELALRNLVANALRHTPPGTQVCVEVWQGPQGCGVSVSDDGQRAGAPAVATATPHGLGLGLGLRLVDRMAEQMGAQLLRDNGQTPMTTRFDLRWLR